MWQFVFYGSEEWIVHFAEGRFPIGDPYGIAVNYRTSVPVSVDNLEDSEPLE